MRRAMAVAAVAWLALAVSCGRGEERPAGSAGRNEATGAPSTAAPLSEGGATPAASGAAAVTAASSSAVLAGWMDPEPADAQSRAEQVVGAEWNRNKTTELENRDKTTELQMAMTTLVDKTSGLQGFGSTLLAKDASLADRLSKLGAEETATEVTIRLPGSVLFDFNSSTIRPDAERTLLEVAEVLRAYANRPVRLEGHTDAVASEDYNQKLSERRAEAVKSWLQAHKVAGAKLATKGLGKSRPIADNATAEGRQRNRRVEIIISKTGK
jgi:outer membrane protein OmpA-like peptidoglycan-associated protein